MKSSILELKGINAGYDKLQILFGVDMSILANNINVIIGPNGAGKSTVLKTVFNLCDIYDGKVTFEDVNITGDPTHKRITSGISIVPQGRQVFTGLSVQENLEMGAYMMSSPSRVKQRMLHVFEHFPILKSKRKDLASSLSGGQQQMLAIGRALMQKPKLLLLDEPSLGLSPKLMKEVFVKIQELRDEGITILMVEQNAKSACDIADKIFVLEEGKVALQGDRKLLKNPKLKKIYLGGHGHK